MIFKIFLILITIPTLFLVAISSKLPTPEDPFDSGDIVHQIYNKDGELLYKLED